jgi:hypothetical protein
MGIFFGGENRRNSNLVVTTACRPALQNLNKAAESTDWRPIPNLAGTIFDKVVYVNFNQSSGYGWTKDQSPIPFSYERIHLIENRAPVLSPICARADPSPINEATSIFPSALPTQII